MEIEKLLNEILDQDLKKCILSSPRKKSQECKKVIVRPVIIKGELLFQFEYHHEKKVLHDNMIPFDANAQVRELIEASFKQVNIFTAGEEIQILASKPSRPRIKRIEANKLSGSAENSNASGTCSDTSGGLNSLSNSAGATLLSHDREKNYIIKDGTPCDFLIRLGVMGGDGRVFKKNYAKFRQINRYLEIVDDVAGELLRTKKASGHTDDSSERNAVSCSNKTSALKIIDFGCGKAYLTFALYYYFHELKGQDVEIIGLDLKKDVISFCNKVSADLGYEGLSFKHGDIADYKDDGCDMVVTLHACDTATDFALINAVSWNAPVILSVPCCQHELFRQIKNDSLRPLLKHGLLKDRFTELLTDSLRGLALEACGYDVQMIEFTTLEHTMKNIMVRAVKKRTPSDKKSKRALTEYNALKESYNVEPATDGLLPAAASAAAETAAC